MNEYYSLLMQYNNQNLLSGKTFASFTSNNSFQTTRTVVEISKTDTHKRSFVEENIAEQTEPDTSPNNNANRKTEIIILNTRISFVGFNYRSNTKHLKWVEKPIRTQGSRNQTRPIAKKSNISQNSKPPMVDPSIHRRISRCKSQSFPLEDIRPCFFFY